VQHDHCFGQAEPRAGETWTNVVVIMTAPKVQLWWLALIHQCRDIA